VFEPVVANEAVLAFKDEVYVFIELLKPYKDEVALLCELLKLNNEDVADSNAPTLPLNELVAEMFRALALTILVA
jgi:hypothetical protein